MGASMWQGLTGYAVAYKSGVSGAVTLPANAALLYVSCRSTAGGTLVIFGGQSIPIIANAAPFVLSTNHLNLVAFGSGASASLVFTGTDSYFVSYATSGNT